MLNSTVKTLNATCRWLTGAVVLLFSLTLIGCEGIKNQDVGVLTGGALGGILGNQIGGGTGRVVATIAGTVAGALIGGSVGHSMDQVDQMRVNQALETAPTGRPVVWNNPDSGYHYEMTPTRTYHSRYGAPCRDYVVRGVIDGKPSTIRGRACRQRDGGWHAVS